MTMPTGPLVALSAREILKRIFGGSESTISENEVANVVRQNVIGKATTVIVASSKAPADEETILLITRRCLDLLSQMSDLEVTFNLAPDGTRSFTIRKTTNIAIEELVRSVEVEAGPVREAQGRESESNAELMARIRERINRSEEEVY
jgi:oligoribonuclease NrnB/cAMP/cGMP phosphodiesterase (DHH superfamily)